MDDLTDEEASQVVRNSLSVFISFSAIQMCDLYIFIFNSIPNLVLVYYELTKLLDSLIAQFVEHFTGITEVMGPKFFRLLFHNCISCVHNCNDLSMFSSLSLQFKCMIFHISHLHNNICRQTAACGCGLGTILNFEFTGLVMLSFCLFCAFQLCPFAAAVGNCPLSEA